MFPKTKRFITVLLRKLRGEDFNKITMKGNEQILKLQKVSENHEADAKAAEAQAEAARIYARQMSKQAEQLTVESQKALVLKSRFEDIFTVSDQDVELYNNLKDNGVEV